MKYELKKHERKFLEKLDKEIKDRRYYSNCLPPTENQFIEFMENSLKILVKSTDYDT